MTIKAGELAVVKTTGETVFVLEVVSATPNYPALSGFMANVRRPIVNNSGIDHVINGFHVEELISLEDHKEERQEEQVKLYSNLKARLDMTDAPGNFKN